MTFTYDVATNTGKVRLLIPDRNLDDYVFEDEEIAAFLAMETTIRSTAALALETIASDQAMVLKAIRLMDLSTDGPKVADSLMKRAAELRAQDEAILDEEDAGFEIAEWVVDDHSYDEKLLNEYLRGSV